MCCFSRPVDIVSDTNIFARLTGKRGRQYLVYSMKMKASEELAMILPIPVPKDTGDDAVRFINLEVYEDFFDDMREGFPVEPSRNKSAGSIDTLESKLAVVDVGSFEASFVPGVKDFGRLDARFRLPEETWEKLPQYSEYGFAVFKLKQGHKKIHPMAFDFPSALGGRLFFPTVHIHDGKVHRQADFDHALYCQLNGLDARLAMHWKESPQPAGMFLDKQKAGELIDPGEHVYQRLLKGTLKNEDTLV